MITITIITEFPSCCVQISDEETIIFGENNILKEDYRTADNRYSIKLKTVADKEYNMILMISGELTFKVLNF